MRKFEVEKDMERGGDGNTVAEGRWRYKDTEMYNRMKDMYYSVNKQCVFNLQR